MGYMTSEKKKKVFPLPACPHPGLPAQQGAGGGCGDFRRPVDVFPSPPEEGGHPRQLGPDGGCAFTNHCGTNSPGKV